MPNILLQIEYDGTDYAGWQIQNRSPSSVVRRPLETIQETIEKVLEQVLQEKVKVSGSGRTDAGVHALGQTANFKTESRLGPARIHQALNALLPDDIRIKKARYAKDDFHACSCARSKVYRYVISNSKVASVFLKRYSWHIPYKLDMPLMKKEAKSIIGRHDFSSFCASGSSAKTRVRTIKKISVKETVSAVSGCAYSGSSPVIIIEIEADGFLYNMARNIVGTLVEIGRGRLAPGSMDKILKARERRTAGPTAQARGLFLVKVKY